MCLKYLIRHSRDVCYTTIKKFQNKKFKFKTVSNYLIQPFKKKPWILGAKLRPHPTDKCKHLAWSETVYGKLKRPHSRNSKFRNRFSITRLGKKIYLIILI